MFQKQTSYKGNTYTGVMIKFTAVCVTSIPFINEIHSKSKYYVLLQYNYAIAMLVVFDFLSDDILQQMILDDLKHSSYFSI